MVDTPERGAPAASAAPAAKRSSRRKSNHRRRRKKNAPSAAPDPAPAAEDTPRASSPTSVDLAAAASELDPRRASAPLDPLDRTVSLVSGVSVDNDFGPYPPPKSPPRPPSDDSTTAAAAAGHGQTPATESTPLILPRAASAMTLKDDDAHSSQQSQTSDTGITSRRPVIASPAPIPMPVSISDRELSLKKSKMAAQLVLGLIVSTVICVIVVIGIGWTSDTGGRRAYDEPDHAEVAFNRRPLPLPAVYSTDDLLPQGDNP